jgi:hypothetical protein
MQLSSILSPALRGRLNALHSLLKPKQPESNSYGISNGTSNGTSKSLSARLVDAFLRTWDLGFTSFGGPPVHFQILHRRFVEGQGGKEKWVDEQTVSLIYTVLSIFLRIHTDISEVPRDICDMSGSSRTREY